MGDIEVFNTVSSLRSRLEQDRKAKKIGLVPTMGALHHGHLALVRESMKINDITVVSIFVNPKQFNNPNDLIAYPRTMERDIELLKSTGDVIVFAPSVEEMYPLDYQPVELELGGLATGMEGEFRPGHFDGVVKVVYRLFEIVQPDYAYFGLKDFQQLAVINFMTKSFNLPVEVVPVEIIRESSGLASSSRNYRLSESQLNDATVIYRALMHAKELASEMSVEEVKTKIRQFFDSDDVRLDLEYFEIVHPETLQPLEDWVPGAHACIAAFSGEVRLIDNMQMISD